MAGASLLTLLDDISVILDDVSLMTKVAVKKTAGVLGDDLALNAEQVSGVKADRELPVVWAVAKGSFVNKLILVPLALLISAIYPPLVTFLLMCGGVYLAYEGAEKIIHKFWPHLTMKNKSPVYVPMLIRRLIWLLLKRTKSKVRCAPTLFYRLKLS